MIKNEFNLIELFRVIMIDATKNARDRSQKEDRCLAMAKRLMFEKKEQWMIFGSCLYTFEDATMAIRAYFNTRDLNLDKDFQYLRLFGFLNATYLQFEAIKQLAEIVKLPNKNVYINKLRHHEIIQARHMLASHVLNYKSREKFYSITIEQVSLRNSNATFRINESQKRIHINFSKSYRTWQDDMSDVMKIIIKKFISTIFKTNKDKISYYNEKLSNITTSRPIINPHIK